ncbi:hypothetical protein GQ53DRAFT_884503 [Thozetella sp. PMI_491]|nr:hypothetical protein GQ53DRAFT_884503 [Thozetella sp. PMI_491]
MDPISAAASILGVVGAIAQATSTATAFMRDVRSARREMLDVKKELAALKAVLEILGDDFADPASTAYPASIIEQIVSIVENSSNVVSQIEQCIHNQGRSRLAWATSGKKDILRLRGDLEVNKSTLNLTLDVISSYILRDIKDDTEHILQDTSTLKHASSDIQADVSRILAGISKIQGQMRDMTRLNENDESNYVLRRHLNDLKMDAETVLDELEENDNFEWLESGDNTDAYFADGPHSQNHTGSRVSSSTPELNASNSPAAPSRREAASSRGVGAQNKPEGRPNHILFTNSNGRQFTIPYEACRTWADMTELIRQSYANEPEHKDLADTKYDLVGSNGQIILQSLWESLVEPGLEVKLQLWKSTSTTELKEPIRFNDCVGRKFAFPFHLCQKWPDMEDLIKNAFLHVEVVGSEVLKGHYDLKDPHGDIVLPSMWEKVVKPGWFVTMDLWPRDDARPLFRLGDILCHALLFVHDIPSSVIVTTGMISGLAQ